jgi:hypothetical protein
MSTAHTLVGNKLGVIVNGAKEWRSVTGEHGMQVLQLRTLIIGVKAEGNGMRLTRSVNCTQRARELTGLKTRDRAQLVARLEVMFNEALSKCVVVTEDETTEK